MNLACDFVYGAFGYMVDRDT